MFTLARFRYFVCFVVHLVVSLPVLPSVGFVGNLKGASLRKAVRIFTDVFLRRIPMCFGNAFVIPF